MQDALAPMMQQYRRLRGSIPADTLLLFRLGDFYELFFEDAKEAASLLNVALTKRNGVPMCGVPYHAAQSYVAKLIKAGRRVAICDQTSEPQPGKIVSRDITQIISAGTVSDLDLLEAKRANYLGAVYNDRGMFGFKQIEIADRARTDNLRDIARDNFTRLRFARLIADCDATPRLDQLRDITLCRVIWHAAHRHAVAFLQRDIEQARCLLCVLKK